MYGQTMVWSLKLWWKIVSWFSRFQEFKSEALKTFALWGKVEKNGTNVFLNHSKQFLIVIPLENTVLFHKNISADLSEVWSQSTDGWFMSQNLFLT